MKVYKFRSLGNCESLDRVIEIVRTGKFWCSRFWELNDPMEGYYLRTPKLLGNGVAQIFVEKSSTLICSFSREGALRKPAMWGYYANGFKGVAIETDVPPKDVRCIDYCDDVIEVVGGEPGIVKKILSRKLTCWRPEEELRVFRTGQSRSIKIGKITGVVIATPYPKTMVNPDVDGRQTKMRAYNCRVGQIRQVCHELGIPVRRARMRVGQIEIKDWIKK